MNPSHFRLLAALCSVLSLTRAAFSQSDLTVHSGGTLTVHTNVQVNNGTFKVESGGAVNIDLGNKVTAANIVFNGTLTVSSNNLVLASGQTYRLFSAATYSGAFLTINLPTLPSTLIWTNRLADNGSLGVQSIPINIQFSTLTYSGSQIVLNGSGGAPNGSYLVLTTTNLNSSATNWVVSTTNYFDSNGNFSFTNTISQTIPRQFFLIQAP